MRFNPIPLIAGCLFLSISLKAQVGDPYSLKLASGSFTPAKNISSLSINEYNQKAARSAGRSFAVLQFEQIPTEQQKQLLKQEGIELLDYIPGYAYTASISRLPDETVLLKVKARSLVELNAAQKMQPRLAAGNFPVHAVKVAGTVDVWISFPRSFSLEEVNTEIRNRNFDIISAALKEHRILELRVPLQRLGELALLPCVEYVQALPGKDEPLSAFWPGWGRDGMRASLLNAPISQGGKNLKGNGVVIGIGDSGDPQPHVDFTGRIISRAALPFYNFPFDHGTHVSGIAGGGGIVNEVRAGFAPKSTILVQSFSNIWTNASTYVNDYGMVLTNNSYGNNDTECGLFGVYDLYSRILDQQAFDLPQLQNVFAAGNSGWSVCPPYPDSFKTVFGGYQSAKNVLTVGNTRPSDKQIFSRSSRGPAKDGRVKPEIAGIGSFITSTGPYAGYYYENTGTSMSAPAVAGGMALLIERYKVLHGGNPKNGLVKALVCNSGDDWGRPGPDFSFGFGAANFWRAINMLESNRFTIGTIAPGPAQTILVNVPSGTAELKVMLYWNDPPAAAVSTQTLVNNLDLEVQTPSFATVLPMILDTLPANVKNLAQPGVDNINNMEQVVIKTPVPGDYTIRILPTSIAVNPSQEYFIVYDLVPTETKLITPIGGEAYLQGENTMMRWDSYGLPENSFTLEYSIDNGSNWTVLNNNISADRRQYFSNAPNEWFVIPNVTTDQARMRITRNSTALSSTSLPFVIHDTLFCSLSPVQCEGYFSIDWTAVPGATGYEVMLLQGTEMVTIATLPNTTLTYTISGLNKDSTYWASVRPLIGTSNSPGRRGLAIFRKPNNGTCAGSIADNDIKADSILSPLRSGRSLTSTSLGSSVPVTIRIKNLDDVVTPGNITVSYILNGGSPVTEILTNPAIPGGGTLTHTFAANANLSVVGVHTLDVTVTQSGDPVAANNTINGVYKQLDNPAITGISYPSVYLDNFDGAPVQSFTRDQVGLTGLDKYDFVNSNDTGRVRTFINTGIAYSGNRAITLDGFMYHPPGVTDSLTGTYNLAAYNSSTDDIRLDFRYKNHGQGNNPANRVWVRGDDTRNWVEAYNLYTNQNPANGTFRFTTSIELSDLLFNAGPSQNFSSSFQVRWGLYGQNQATGNDGGGGYTLDDVRLYLVTDDMQMLSIDTPVVNSCGLTANTPVRISVRNSRNSVVNTVPVRFRVNGGAWTTENIPAIAANATVQYTFTGTANLLALGSYLIEAQVLYGTDSYNANDTTSVTITNTPVITVTNTSPHLEDFESSNGYWYTAGNSTWEYGTPASYKIKRAASGGKAWKTRLAGNYNDAEIAYLYSPCYDVSGVSNPTLSFSVALDIEDCGAFTCDGAYVEYSLDAVTWSRLGGFGQGTNWYNKNYSGNNLWSVANYHRWHVATIPLSVIPVPVAQLTQLRFRFVMNGDPAANREGIAIDDIHIYSNPYGIYDATATSPVVNQPALSGTAWVDFVEPGTNKLVASVNPNGVNMGSTDAQSYIFSGPARISSWQYYHPRNITIKPTTVNLQDSATVRFYFKDTETETLINATGCGYCSKPAMAYELGVTKYSDGTDANEDGTLANNTSGTYLYIIPAKTRIVPFDIGYYAEFKVKDFCELWLNNGGFNGVTPLPLQLLSFTARKQGSKDVLLEWITEQEMNVDRFEVEVAAGNAAYQQNRFVVAGTVQSFGNSTGQQQYSLTDLEPGKTGTRYYRLRIIDKDGSVRYSSIQPVSFSNEVNWQVYPNPSDGFYGLVLQGNNGEVVHIKVYDATGRMVQQLQQTATGFVQKVFVDLREKSFAPGLYHLEVAAAEQKRSFRVLKQ